MEDRGFQDQRGQALVEMAIMLPVYILLAYGTFFMGEIGIAQIAAQKAARYGAWTTQNPNRGRVFFRTYPFPYASSPSINRRRQFVDLFTRQDVSRALNSSSGGQTYDSQTIGDAANMLNGIGQRAMFSRSQAQVSFSFRGLGLLKFGSVSIRAYHVVDLPTHTPRERESKIPRLWHSIEEYLGHFPQ